MLLDKSRNEAKAKTNPVVDVTGDVILHRNWNVRSMNQGKLEVVKQEMARVNIDILGISELKKTGMGEFNSDNHYIYLCGQGSLRRNEVALIVNKRVQNAVLGCNLKNGRMISVRFQGKPSSSVQFRCSVCPTLCASMDCSTPGLPVSITNSQSLLKLISSHW